MVWREEQVADYPQTNDERAGSRIPRGCQKGACFSERMYDPGRVAIRSSAWAPRGSGRWKRISWEQETREVADAMLDTIEQEGSDRVIWELGPSTPRGR